MDENKYIDIRRKNVFFSQKTKFSFVQIYSSAIDKGVILRATIVGRRIETFALRNVSSIEKEK